MSYTDEELATILDVKADQLRGDKHAHEAVLELATLLSDVEEVAVETAELDDGAVRFESADRTDGISLFVPRDIAGMACDECDGTTQTYVHTADGLALCPNCAD